MRRRCEEAGEELTPITPLEKLAVRFHNVYITSELRQSSSTQHESENSHSE